MFRVLFFDDDPKRRANEALRQRLEENGVHVDCVKLFREFEDAASKIAYDVVILDVMAKSSETLLRYDDDKKIVSDDEIGIELLRRLRGGYYKRHAMHYADISIFVRTANGAHHMQILYETEGGHYVDPADNMKLVEMILEQARRKDACDGKGIT